jgi:hypothetical protein
VDRVTLETMAANADLLTRIDAFMAAPKRVAGIDSPPPWGPGFSPQEREMKYPLELGGELAGAYLMIVCFPQERSLKFRVGMLYGGMICRLDYTDETHPNTLDGVRDSGLPAAVVGPHYHSWRLNRRFFHGVTKPPQLHDACPYNEPGRSFDAVLRWFCTDTGIESPPANHRIALPPSDLLL